MEAVLDSSRYFVLRAEDQGRKAYVGVGFTERAESFDFSKSIREPRRLIQFNLTLHQMLRFRIIPNVRRLCSTLKRLKAMLHPLTFPLGQRKIILSRRVRPSQLTFLVGEAPILLDQARN